MGSQARALRRLARTTWRHLGARGRHRVLWLVSGDYRAHRARMKERLQQLDRADKRWYGGTTQGDKEG